MDNSINNQSIGFFDSGLGGLSVVEEVKKKLPNESIEYFADNLNQPYGEKSHKQLVGFSISIMDFLLSKKIKACVIACNTATAASLTILQKQFPLPIIGMVAPGVKHAISKTTNKKIGILATEFTVKSEIYAREIKKFQSEFKVYSTYCPECVAIVEEGKNNTPFAERIMSKYLLPLKKNKVDTLIIGCTHYAFLKDIIHEVMGEDVLIVDPAQSVAKELHKLLLCKGMLSASGTPKQNYYTSGNRELVERIAGKILKRRKFSFQKIVL